MIYTDQINEYISKNLITPDKHPALYDYQFQKNLADAPWNEWLSKPNYFDIYDEYIDTFIKWIHSSKNNKIRGLENFKFTDVIVGTTQAFDEAYYRYRNRQLRTFVHEYAYHSRNVSVQYLDTDSIDLNNNDWIIISLPFSGTGKTAPDYLTILEKAKLKNIPVLIDCAWFGTCSNIDFDFDHPAIHEVTFSLSKGIGLGNMRTGLRFSNYNDGYIRQQNNYKHLVFSNMQIGIWQMDKFTPDFITNKYQESYKNMCNTLNITSTDCMHVAMYNNKLLGVRNLVKEFYVRN